jgi:benzoylformate decarboxylase
MKVAELLLQTLEANGVRHIFGNPGTTEIPLVRLCERRHNLKYVVALSEIAAVPMADGYARAKRTLGVVNLHVAPGLGNGMGGLYTAATAQTPLLALIGGQDRRFLHTGPILWGPVEQMAASVCKAVFSMTSLDDAAPAMRQALRVVLTPPYAPVALVCPPDLLEENTSARPQHVNAPSLASLSSAQAGDFARVLARSRRPAIVAAEDVHWNNAAGALAKLAETLAAPVYIAPYTGALPVDSARACYAGYLPPSFRQISERLARHDALLFVGGRGMRTTLFSDVRMPQKKLWIGNDPGVLASAGEFEHAAIADTRDALVAIARSARMLVRHRKPAKSWRAAVTPPTFRKGVFHPSRAIHALIGAFRDSIWIDESGLSTSDVRQWMQVPAGDYLINGSGGIGWGLAAAVGAAIGNPNRQVVAIIGDGSALYASEALWTAAHHRTNLMVVILANRRYATLNEAASRLTGKTIDLFTIEPPIIDFSGLAKLYGWRYARAAKESELQAFLGAGRHGGNTLLELKLDPAVKPVTASRHF